MTFREDETDQFPFNNTDRGVYLRTGEGMTPFPTPSPSPAPLSSSVDSPRRYPNGIPACIPAIERDFHSWLLLLHVADCILHLIVHCLSSAPEDLQNVDVDSEHPCDKIGIRYDKGLV